MSYDKEIDEKLCDRLLNFVYPPESELLDKEISKELVRLNIDTSQALERVKEAIRQDRLLKENAKLMALTENERDEYKDRIIETIKVLKKADNVRSKIEPDYTEHTIKLAVDELTMYIDVALDILMRNPQ